MAPGRTTGVGFLTNVAINPHLTSAQRDAELVSAASAVNPEVYLPGVRNPATLVVRGNQSAVTLAGTVREHVRAVVPSAPLTSLRAMARSAAVPGEGFVLAAVASHLPARRSASVEPLAALKSEQDDGRPAWPDLTP